MKNYFLFTILILFTKLLSAQGTERIIAGNQFYRTAQFDLAEDQYRRASEAEPKNTTAYFNLANALQKQNKFEDAVRVLDRLTRITSDTMLLDSIYYNQGVAYTKQKNLEASIEAYKNALRHNPNDQEARENLQKALLEQKQKNQQDQQKQKQDPKMSQKDADQKLNLLQQKEKELMERQQNRNKRAGNGQSQDW